MTNIWQNLIINADQQTQNSQFWWHAYVHITWKTLIMVVNMFIILYFVMYKSFT
jgi:hypothetical protein